MFLGNWPPTPPLSQYFALSAKCSSWLRGGGRVGGQVDLGYCLEKDDISHSLGFKGLRL